MKLPILAICAVLLSFSSYAHPNHSKKLCSLEGYALGDLSTWNGESRLKETHSKGVSLKEAMNFHPEATELFSDLLEDEFCQKDPKAFQIIEFISPTAQIMTAVYSIDDNCDGGNSFGLVLDSKKNVYASINDYDFYCK